MKRIFKYSLLMVFLISIYSCQLVQQTEVESTTTTDSAIALVGFRIVNGNYLDEFQFGYFSDMPEGGKYSPYFINYNLSTVVLDGDSSTTFDAFYYLNLNLSNHVLLQEKFYNKVTKTYSYQDLEEITGITDQETISYQIQDETLNLQFKGLYPCSTVSFVLYDDAFEPVTSFDYDISDVEVPITMDVPQSVTSILHVIQYQGAEPVRTLYDGSKLLYGESIYAITDSGERIIYSFAFQTDSNEHI